MKGLDHMTLSRHSQCAIWQAIAYKHSAVHVCMMPLSVALASKGMTLDSMHD